MGSNAGNFLGAGHPGSKHGILNGCIIVHGNVGLRAADRMRRGLIVVLGNAGMGACSSMIAGTFVLFGNAAGSLGCQMRRGTIICMNQPDLESGCFHRQEFAAREFVNLIAKYLHKLNVPIPDHQKLCELKYRFVGDLSYGGMGEILSVNH